MSCVHAWLSHQLALAPQFASAASDSSTSLSAASLGFVLFSGLTRSDVVDSSLPPPLRLVLALLAGFVGKSVLSAWPFSNWGSTNVYSLPLRAERAQ